jgi:hypothetical protein
MISKGSLELKNFDVNRLYLALSPFTAWTASEFNISMTGITLKTFIIV